MQELRYLRGLATASFAHDDDGLVLFDSLKQLFSAPDGYEVALGNAAETCICSNASSRLIGGPL